MAAASRLRPVVGSVEPITLLNRLSWLLATAGVSHR
jgi:hypothetical protein